MSEQFPYSFGKYRMEAEIGRGGFGTVFRAEDVDLGRPVAIKVLDPLYMRDQRWVARFRREARMMASLDHPNIVPIYDINEEEGRLYIAMKYIDGPELADLISEEGGLPWDRVVAIVDQIASALDYAHQRDIIHRDIKPANILISNGQAMLTDFGLAQIVSSNSLSASVFGGVTGTYNYISPEVFNDEAVTPASDVYALGCVLYEMLTGQMLVEGTTPAAVMMTHVKGVTLDKPLPADTPSGAHDIFEKALAINPADRYASAGELTEELQRITDETPIAPPPAEKAGLPGWIWWAVAVIGLFILVLGIRAAFFGGDDNEPEVVEVTRIVTEKEEVEVTVVVESPTEAVSVVAEDSSTDPDVTVTAALISPPAVDSSLPPNDPALGTIWQRPQDKMNMVYVPSGSFLMGSEDGEENENPVHEVSLDGFWIDQTEITNSQFADFLNKMGNQEEGGFDWVSLIDGRVEEDGGDFVAQPEYADHPVAKVTWYGAKAYCGWIDGQLPTEAQWEYAARGPESRIYPWGIADPTCSLAQFGDCSGETAPGGSFGDGASWVGAVDMAGNVWEWVNDWYDGSYYANSPVNNPQGPGEGDRKLLRGGSWASKSIRLRSSYRFYTVPVHELDYVGFRCSLPGK